MGKEVASCAQDNVTLGGEVKPYHWIQSTCWSIQHFEWSHFSMSRLHWHARHRPRAAVTACGLMSLVQLVAKQNVFCECVRVFVFVLERVVAGGSSKVHPLVNMNVYKFWWQSVREMLRYWSERSVPSLAMMLIWLKTYYWVLLHLWVQTSGSWIPSTKNNYHQYDAKL